MLREMMNNSALGYKVIGLVDDDPGKRRFSLYGVPVLGSRADIPAIIEAAAQTHTVIELNANPRRLDMDWRWWPLAKAKGVKCAINPDAHSVYGLQDLIFGVGAARKGWLTREDVINTFPLGRVEEELMIKRGA